MTDQLHDEVGGKSPEAPHPIGNGARRAGIDAGILRVIAQKCQSDKRHHGQPARSRQAQP